MILCEALTGSGGTGSTAGFTTPRATILWLPLDTVERDCSLHNTVGVWWKYSHALRYCTEQRAHAATIRYMPCLLSVARIKQFDANASGNVPH